jgi:hypothetical protein
MDEKIDGLLQDIKDDSSYSKHALYAEVVGTIPDFHSSRRIDDPEVEEALQRLDLNEDMQDLGTGYLVIQDNTGERFKGTAFTCADLKAAICQQSPSHYAGMLASSTKHRRKEYFLERERSDDVSRAYALVLAFYTGSGSNNASRGASLCIRTGNTRSPLNLEAQEAINGALPIFYFMVGALAQIPYFFGECSRCVQLDVDELAAYTPGTVVAWTQFASSKKGSATASAFQDRNTVFHIHSMTGRHIAYFSDYTSEDEVLFLPFSCFLTVGKFEDGPITHIYLRQIEFGSSNKTILWVDDHIFEEQWENKGHMEATCAANVNENIHFVCKPTTELAVSWLASPLAEATTKPWSTFQVEDHFRIVTDMTRTNESSPGDAGARLVAEVINLGYTCKILVFTSDKKAAEEKIKQACGGAIPSNVKVTIMATETRQFISFDGVVSTSTPTLPSDSSGAGSGAGGGASGGGGSGGGGGGGSGGDEEGKCSMS